MKKLQHTPFFKYSNEILDIRKNEFESVEIYRIIDKIKMVYDISEIKKTFYGKKFLNIIQIKDISFLKPEQFKMFNDISSKLNLIIKVIDLS